MPLLVGKETLDTPSSDGTCVYPAKALGGSPIKSPNIYINKKQVEFYTSTTLPENVEGVKINPLSPLPCQPGNRVIVANVNQSVYFNKQLPAVQGDKAQLLGSDRPLTAPFLSSNVIIANKAN
jgi:hypothetical protein